MDHTVASNKSSTKAWYWISLFGYCWAARKINQPSAHRLSLLGPPSPPYVKWFCWSYLENGIQVNSEAWDNKCIFPPSSSPALHLQITFVPLTLDRHSCFTHRYGSHPLTAPGSFLFPPTSAPPSCSCCPSKFPGDFILPISNRISTQFAMLHVTLLANPQLI